MSKIPPKIFKIFNYKKKVIKFKKFKNQNINKNYLKWINDKDLMKHSRHGQNKQDKSTVSKYVKSMKNNWFLIICVKKNKYFKHIGNISVRFYKEDESASISILIGSSKFRNIGLGKAIWQCMMRRLSTINEIKLIKAGTFYKNSPMIKIFKQNNMKLSKKKLFINARKNINR
tara:strand:- start:27804 stop:28322 length:519 start_codon:yes stop_codon:yes gene_type:complete